MSLAQSYAWLLIAADSRRAGRLCQESKIGVADAVGALDRFCPPRTMTEREPARRALKHCVVVKAVRPCGPELLVVAPADRRSGPPQREPWRERRRGRRVGGASGPVGPP
jgi:hypothetical protein